MKYLIFIFLAVCASSFLLPVRDEEPVSFVRTNLLGYKPSGAKVAIFCSLKDKEITAFEVIDVETQKTVYKGKAGKAFGAYARFKQSYRLNFSNFKKPGTYYIRAGRVLSRRFTIGENVYKGAADFCLRYMRQQRSFFNPYLKDSCHTHDAYTMYGPMPDSTRIDVAGGWHDASDYLQYSTTSANATYHLLAAYRDFPTVFGDHHAANGLPGANGRADIMDEAKWGLDWLLKMHPQDDWLFNQIADDRDHQGMRMPKEDSFYGRGYERPVYFCTGEPQGLFKYKNRASGVASTAGKFSSAFALGASLMKDDGSYRQTLKQKALSAYVLGTEKKGVCQTAPGRAPYFYEEDNWVDDMELAAAQLSLQQYPGRKENFLSNAIEYADQEKITPWLGADTARHYQWYPFINLGHYEIAKQTKGGDREKIIGYYKAGIEKVWQKARHNAFYRGVPFIWCSNNLTTSFAIQCYWYRELTGDNTYQELEQANFDWLFGCNPWGTSMVYGLPANGDTPSDPHSAFTHLKNYPIDGGLVDGPVYGNIYKNLIGITLYQPDEYAHLQSDLVVYHDDYGDYSTNEPTMDGTASLIYLLAAKEAGKKSIGAITRGDTMNKKLAIVFTGDEFAEGGNHIASVLKQQKTPASFFFTGRFYRNPSFKTIIQQLKAGGHYLGAHSDQHLLYCDWTKRDSLLVSQKQFSQDLSANYQAMEEFGIQKKDAKFFLPPYEWYNDTITAWTNQLGLQLINYTPGTKSHADYTAPGMKNYTSSETIMESIRQYENARGMNGFILLLHIGAGPQRTDKFYHQLPQLIGELKMKNYQLVRIDELLK
jgi:endoglucanase